jgi:Domain of unknown function (DUF4282)
MSDPNSPTGGPGGYDQGGYDQGGPPPPPPASPPPAGAQGGRPAPAPRNFFGALFDFGFNTFATPVVIKVLYILGLIAIALGYVAIVISGFADSAATGLIALIGGAVGALFYVIFFRVFLEFYYAVVRMSEDIRAMRNRS